jgi:hypothetical protein
MLWFLLGFILGALATVVFIYVGMIGFLFR